MSVMNPKLNIFPPRSRNIFYPNEGNILCNNSGMDIRQRIDALLTEKGWGRKTLSKRMGVSDTFVRMFIENPTQQMGHENLIKAAEALGVTTDYLLHGTAPTQDAETRNVTDIWDHIDPADRKTAIEVLKRFANTPSKG